MLTERERFNMAEDRIILDHGAGGAASHRLIKDYIFSKLRNPLLEPLDDSAVLEMGDGIRIAMTTDSYVIDPIFFPGGDIGSLAVYGTVNDLSMQGATPLFLSLAFIIEEGLPLKDLKRIMDSISKAAKEANVDIVTGDTKVVHRGQADRIYINTAGIGKVPKGIEISSHLARPGDLVIINGDIADHGMAVLFSREGLDPDIPISSDSAPLNGLVSEILKISDKIHVLKDPTRGGLGSALNEIAQNSNVSIFIYEDRIPIKEEVKAACELLGFDPLYIANEGKCIVIVEEEDADRVLEAMKRHPLGKDSRIIGEIREEYAGKVYMKTKVGGTRIISMLEGEQAPRIC